MKRSNRRRALLLGLIALALAACGSLERLRPRTASQAGDRSATAANSTFASRAQESYGQLPLSFEPNLGQTDKAVKFVSRGRGLNLFLTRSGAVLTAPGSRKKVQTEKTIESESRSLRLE